MALEYLSYLPALAALLGLAVPILFLFFYIKKTRGYIKKSKDKAQTKIMQLEHDLAQAQQSRQNFLIKEAQLLSRLDAMQSINTNLETAKQQMSLEFKNLANEIFEAKQTSFKEQSQTQLNSLLKPLGDKIKGFEKRIEDTYYKESRERFSLINEVKNLADLNARISKDAINLTNALKGESKTQGSWGEVILERVLEKSGLVKGREYEIQVSLHNDEGRRFQPDVIVKLPDGKDLIVDSKVSLVAYERYCSSEDIDETAKALKQHVLSIRQHIRQLGDKSYQKLSGVRTLDFVLLFIPIEAAFSVAVQEEGELFSEAFDKNIVLVAPSTLLTTLRTIQNIWRYEHQNTNAQEIAEKAGKLYDKFVGFVADLDDVGMKLVAAQSAYDNAQKKLISGRGNLVTRVEALKSLGAKTNKSLPKKVLESSD